MIRYDSVRIFSNKFQIVTSDIKIYILMMALPAKFLPQSRVKRIVFTWKKNQVEGGGRLFQGGDLIFMGLLPVTLSKRRYGYSFISSMATIVFLFLLVLIGIFPNMIPSSIDYASNSLTIYNSSAQRITLIVTMFIAAMGLPLVFLYGTILYTIFKEKTKITDSSY